MVQPLESERKPFEQREQPRKLPREMHHSWLTEHKNQVAPAALGEQWELRLQRSGRGKSHKPRVTSRWEVSGFRLSWSLGSYLSLCRQLSSLGKKSLSTAHAGQQQELLMLIVWALATSLGPLLWQPLLQILQTNKGSLPPSSQTKEALLSTLALYI